MRTLTRTCLVGIALVGFVAGCSDDSDEFPTGVYHPIGSSDAEGTMEFTSDGTFVLKGSDGLVFTEGTYSVDGDEFTWETDTYCEAQFGTDAQLAVYVWEQDGDTLTMEPQGEDPCTDRPGVVARGFEKSTG